MLLWNRLGLAMTPEQKEELDGWMSKVNTQTLELILLQGASKEVQWYTQEMTNEIQRRRAVRTCNNCKETKRGVVQRTFDGEVVTIIDLCETCWETKVRMRDENQ